MSQTHSENVTRFLRPFFPGLIKIPSLPQNILWIYRKCGKVQCTLTTVLAPSALLKEISPTCPYFCFATWSSRSACEVDSLLVKLGLHKKKKENQQVKKKKKDVHKGLRTMPKLLMGFQSLGPHQDQYSLLKTKSTSASLFLSSQPTHVPATLGNAVAPTKLYYSAGNPSPSSPLIVRNHWAAGTGYLYDPLPRGWACGL